MRLNGKITLFGAILDMGIIWAKIRNRVKIDYNPMIANNIMVA
ncbi:MAG: hypothetical protein SFZ02_14255 [bacterium]|nr:hypothetical protein [bacterium]